MDENVITILSSVTYFYCMFNSGTKWFFSSIRLTLWLFLSSSAAAECLWNEKVVYHRVSHLSFLSPATQSGLCAAERNCGKSLFFCTCPARSTDSFQNCSRWGTHWVSYHAGNTICFYTTHCTTAESRLICCREAEQSNSPCDAPLQLSERLVLSRYVSVSAAVWRASVWRRRPGWQPGMSWCLQRTTLTLRTATTSARVRDCYMCLCVGRESILTLLTVCMCV